MSHDDERLEGLLRRSLHAEAEEVVPAGDGLARIREKVARRRARFAWLHPSALVFGTAAAVGVAGAGVLVAQDDTSPAPRGGPASTARTTTSPSERPSTSPSTSPSASPRGTSASPTAPSPVTSAPPAASPPAVPPAPDGPTSSTTTGQVATTVPVYRVGDTEDGPRLYRELTPVRVVEGDARSRLAAAVAAAVSGRPADTDYADAWPSGTRVRSVAVSGDLASVDLSQEAGAALDDGLGAQQLVWTVTATDQDVRRVRLLVDGDAVRTAARAPQGDVLAPVWVIDPAPGAAVGETFTARGDASVFEGTVTWELRADGEVVDEGFATASEGAPGRGTWSAQVTAPGPGTYVLRAYERSAEDGSARFADTKRVTVR